MKINTPALDEAIKTLRENKKELSKLIRKEYMKVYMKEYMRNKRNFVP
jgi:hypothetical protein